MLVAYDERRNEGKYVFMLAYYCIDCREPINHKKILSSSTSGVNSIFCNLDH